MIKPSTINVTVNGLDVTAGYYEFKGFPGSLEEPPEPAHVEIEFVEINDVDMSRWLTDEFIDDCCTAVEEALTAESREGYEPDFFDNDDAYEYGDPKRSDFLDGEL